MNLIIKYQLHRDEINKKRTKFSIYLFFGRKKYYFCKENLNWVKENFTGKMCKWTTTFQVDYRETSFSSHLPSCFSGTKVKIHLFPEKEHLRKQSFLR